MHNLRDLIIASGKLINSLIGITASIAVLVFMWGIAIFIWKAGDPKAQEEGRNRMVWGIVALFVMVSVWGIVNLIRGELGLWDPFSAPDSTFPTYENPGFNTPPEIVIPTYTPPPNPANNVIPCNKVFSPTGCL
jgi:hypothetical protein